jgi:hypothetical protein
MKRKYNQQKHNEVSIELIDKFKRICSDEAKTNGVKNNSNYDIEKLYRLTLLNTDMIYQDNIKISEEFWIIFLSCLKQHSDKFEYKTMEEFTSKYQNFKSYGKEELNKLKDTANVMKLLFTIKNPKGLKGFCIRVIPQVVEGIGTVYITGSGQKRCTSDRCDIFEVESNQITEKKVKKEKKEKKVKKENKVIYIYNDAPPINNGGYNYTDSPINTDFDQYIIENSFIDTINNTYSSYNLKDTGDNFEILDDVEVDCLTTDNKQNYLDTNDGYATPPQIPQEESSGIVFDFSLIIKNNNNDNDKEMKIINASNQLESPIRIVDEFDIRMSRFLFNEFNYSNDDKFTISNYDFIEIANLLTDN